jgi:DNA-binding CsgD family transcriptional regulator
MPGKSLVPDPLQARTQALEAIHALVPSSFLGFTNVAIGADGELAYRDIDGMGSRQVLQHWSTFDGTPCLAPWDPRHAPRALRNRFSLADPRRAAARDAASALYDPVGLHHTSRMLAYDGDDFIGYLAMHRFADEPAFSTAEQRRFRRRSHQALEWLVAAVRTERPPPDGASFLLASNGTLLQACQRGARWITPSIRTAFADRIRTFDRPEGETTFVLGRAEVRLVRLQGDGTSRFLAVCRALHRPRLNPLAQLTDAQRAVADFAVVGATVAEIASTLDRSPETVRSHLKAVYRRTGTANRLELARLYPS